MKGGFETQKTIGIRGGQPLLPGTGTAAGRKDGRNIFKSVLRRSGFSYFGAAQTKIFLKIYNKCNNFVPVVKFCLHLGSTNRTVYGH